MVTYKVGICIQVVAENGYFVYIAYCKMASLKLWRWCIESIK